MKLILLWFPALWEAYSSGQILIMLWLTREVLAINAAFFLNRPDLLPKYDPVTKFKHWQMQHEKSLNSPCLYVCVNLWFDFLSARRWIQQRLADMIDLSTRLAGVNCLLDWLIVRPSATAQTWFTAGVLRHEAWLSISRPQRLYQLISY